MEGPTPPFRSSIAKKLITGITGVFLMLFVMAHLAGNLTLLVGRDAFNGYASKLESLGELLYVAEAGLIVVFVLHALSAVNVWLGARGARSIDNAMAQTKGPPSKQTLSSRTMIITGSVLLIFVVAHVVHFKFGRGIAQGYVTELHGEQVRDLYRLVVEEFKNPLIVFAYMAVMALLGFHLRHGFWSAFQSLGALNDKLRPLAFSVGVVFAAVIAAGFLILPLYLFLFADAPGASVAMVGHP